MMKQKGDEKKAFLFILPSLIGFLVFLLFPILFSLLLSFCEWDLISGFSNISFVGLRNFKALWSDEWFTVSLKNNLIFTIGVVPITILLALLLAMILNKSVYAKGTLRLLYFVPYISNIVAVSVVWLAIFHPTLGPLNSFLTALGVKSPPGWLASTTWAMPAIIIMSVWLGLGYCIVIYMAGLQGIPLVLYEAATIDGANTFQKFRHITVPMISPTTFFLVITRIIHSFQVFGPINIMTQGGPGQSTTVLVFHIYRSAFRFYKMGYASAIAWVLFVMIFIVTLVQWQKQKEWVSYN